MDTSKIIMRQIYSFFQISAHRWEKFSLLPSIFSQNAAFAKGYLHPLTAAQIRKNLFTWGLTEITEALFIRHLTPSNPLQRYNCYSVTIIFFQFFHSERREMLNILILYILYIYNIYSINFLFQVSCYRFY